MVECWGKYLNLNAPLHSGVQMGGLNYKENLTMSGSQNTCSHPSQVLVKMSVKLSQFIELEQTCVEYG